MIPDKEYFTEKQTEEIIKQLNHIKKLNFNIDMDKPSCNNLYAYYAGEFPSRNSKCESINNSVIIRGNGSIHICSDYGYEIGRIGEGNLNKMYNNEKAKKLRRLFAKGLLPSCYRCCALDYKY